MPQMAYHVSSKLKALVKVPLLLIDLFDPLGPYSLVPELDMPVWLLSDSSTQCTHAELYKGPRIIHVSGPQVVDVGVIVWIAFANGRERMRQSVSTDVLNGSIKLLGRGHG